eukprot:3764316-Pyramimonas_sp.AAC.1
MHHYLPKRAMSMQDPVARLLKALYGHPRSGGDWDAHFAHALWNAGSVSYTHLTLPTILLV